MASIFDLFSASPGQQAARQAGAALSSGYKTAKRDVTQGYGQGISSYQQALPAWQTIFQQGQNLVPTAQGALGVGTPQQIAAADTAFQQSIPGQEFQALLPDIYETSLRRGGVTGQTGEIPIDLTNRAMQALDQFYPGWQASLEKGYGLEGTGAAGETGVYGAIGGAQIGQGKALADIATQKAQAKAGTIANVFGAGQAADANTLNALFGLGSLGVGLMSGGLGGFGLPGGGGGGLGGEALAGMGGGGPFMSNAGDIYYGG